LRIFGKILGDRRIEFSTNRVPSARSYSFGLSDHPE
jgi:hypothetical protein